MKRSLPAAAAVIMLATMDVARAQDPAPSRIDSITKSARDMMPAIPALPSVSLPSMPDLSDLTERSIAKFLEAKGYDVPVKRSRVPFRA